MTVRLLFSVAALPNDVTVADVSPSTAAGHQDTHLFTDTGMRILEVFDWLTESHPQSEWCTFVHECDEDGRIVKITLTPSISMVDTPDPKGRRTTAYNESCVQYNIMLSLDDSSVSQGHSLPAYSAGDIVKMGRNGLSEYVGRRDALMTRCEEGPDRLKPYPNRKTTVGLTIDANAGDGEQSRCAAQLSIDARVVATDHMSPLGVLLHRVEQ